MYNKIYLEALDSETNYKIDVLTRFFTESSGFDLDWNLIFHKIENNISLTSREIIFLEYAFNLQGNYTSSNIKKCVNAQFKIYENLLLVQLIILRDNWNILMDFILDKIIKFFAGIKKWFKK